MRIGIFGDSFADRNPYNPESPFTEDESWIAYMENAGHEPITYGKTGTSTWYSFEQFLAHHEQFDHIIFCYSSMHRIHHLPEGIEDLSFLTYPDQLYELRKNKNLTQRQELDIVRILTGHVPNLSTTFDLFVRQHIFDDVNNLCRNKNIKLVNLLTFDDRKDKNYSIDLSLRAGECLYNLFEISRRELPSMDRVDNRWCHLSHELNSCLSVLLSKSLNSTELKIVDLLKHPDFNKTNPEITKRYMDAET